MKKITITGASGFLGSHITGIFLNRGNPVNALLRESSVVSTTMGDSVISRVNFMNPDSIAEAILETDVIIHAAGATSASSQEEFDRANALVTKNLLTAREKSSPDSLFIYISSQAASGPAGRGPVTAYGRSKLLGEFAVREAENWIIVRPPAIFGARDPASSPILRSAMKGFFVSPWKNRGGFCLVYVRDLAELIAILPEHPETLGVTLEPSYGKLFSWLDFHRILEQAAGRRILHIRIPPFLVHTAGFMSEALASISGTTPFFCRDKCRELLATDWTPEEGLTERLTGWKPSMTVEDAMRETFQWLQKETLS
jgi:nucleoside-diphosphate-sugar epimerase